MVDEHILNEIETQIEKATLQLFKQEEVFANIVQQCIGLGYDFASIQLIRSEEQIKYLSKINYTYLTPSCLLPLA